MSVYDWIILGVCLLSLLAGMSRGLVQEALSILKWLVAFFSAKFLTPSLMTRFSHDGAPDDFKYWMVFVLVGIGAFLFMMIISKWLREIVRSFHLQGPDKFFGAIFGLARGVIVGILLTAAVSYTTIPDSGEFRRISVFFDPMYDLTASLFPNIPRHDWDPRSGRFVSASERIERSSSRDAGDPGDRDEYAEAEDDSSCGSSGSPERGDIVSAMRNSISGIQCMFGSKSRGDARGSERARAGKEYLRTANAGVSGRSKDSTTADALELLFSGLGSSTSRNSPEGARSNRLRNAYSNGFKEGYSRGLFKGHELLDHMDASGRRRKIDVEELLDSIRFSFKRDGREQKGTYRFGDQMLTAGEAVFVEGYHSGYREGVQSAFRGPAPSGVAQKVYEASAGAGGKVSKWLSKVPLLSSLVGKDEGREEAAKVGRWVDPSKENPDDRREAESWLATALGNDKPRKGAMQSKAGDSEWIEHCDLQNAAFDEKCLKMIKVPVPTWVKQVL